MTTKAHSTLTGSDLHEPKGVAGSASGKVYVADGAGSGAWTALVNGTFKITPHLYNAAGASTWTKPASLIGIKVTLIGGGGGSDTSSANVGGDSTFKSMTAGGGGATTGSSGFGAGGTATGGDLNINGLSGQRVSATLCPYFTGFFNSLSVYPGQGNLNSSGAYAASGAATIKWYAASALSATETITVGAGGTTLSGTGQGTFGQGIIEEYIQV